MNKTTENQEGLLMEQSSSQRPLGLLVDLNRPQAYAQCYFLAPCVFELRGEEALWYDSEPDPAERERVLRAAGAKARRRSFIPGGK
jgi:hypothetical protein